MRRLTSVAICAFLLLFIVRANAQNNSQAFLIKGTINVIDSGVVRMFSTDGSSVADSSVIVNGQFIMRGKIGLPERRIFKIAPGNWSLQAFVEDTVITFAIDTTGAQRYNYKTAHGNDSYALIWEIKQTGSKMADVYAQYQKETGQTNFISLLKKLKAVKTNADAANIKIELDSMRKPMLARQKAWIENYINQYPASIAGVYMFNEFYHLAFHDAPLTYLQPFVNRFSGPAKASVYYQQLTRAVADLKNVKVGSLAPDFTLQKRDKSKFTLSAMRGSFTMIDFWASWCVPCRKAIPNWKKVYAKYHQKGFTIVSVSGDRYWKDWLPALDKEQMPWTQVIDEFPSKNSAARVNDLYRTPSLPFYVLLDKEGKVILASDNEDAMMKKIDEVLQ